MASGKKNFMIILIPTISLYGAKMQRQLKQKQEPAGDTNEAYKRYETLLINEDIVRIAKLNKIFVPVITNTSNQSADIYKLTDGDKEYIAVFNFSSHKKNFDIEIDIGPYTATELWSDEVYNGDKTLSVKLNGKDATLFEIKSKQ